MYRLQSFSKRDKTRSLCLRSNSVREQVVLLGECPGRDAALARLEERGQRVVRARPHAGVALSPAAAVILLQT